MQSLDVPLGYKRIKWQKFTVISFMSTWAGRMSFSSLRFNYVQFLWLLLEVALKRKKSIFFPFFFCLYFLPFIVLFPSKCPQAPIQGAGAMVCSDLLWYLLVLSDRLKHWMRMANHLRWGWPETPSVFTATSCFLALSVINTEHRSQSRHRH